jgi:hypothetical protein
MCSAKCSINKLIMFLHIEIQWMCAGREYQIVKKKLDADADVCRYEIVCVCVCVCARATLQIQIHIDVNSN